MWYEQTLFYKDPRLALTLTLIIIIVNLLRDKIGTKITVAISLFLGAILLIGIEGLIELVMSAISGALVTDHIRSSVKKEVQTIEKKLLEGEKK